MVRVGTLFAEVFLIPGEGPSSDLQGTLIKHRKPLQGREIKTRFKK